MDNNSPICCNEDNFGIVKLSSSTRDNDRHEAEDRKINPRRKLCRIGFVLQVLLGCYDAFTQFTFARLPTKLSGLQSDLKPILRTYRGLFPGTRVGRHSDYADRRFVTAGGLKNLRWLAESEPMPALPTSNHAHMRISRKRLRD
eukprot:752856-Hanusia_phi.AAC.1